LVGSAFFRIELGCNDRPPYWNSLLTPNVCRYEQEPRIGVVMLGTILLIILILILVGSLPTWPYSGGWGLS
jgi:hypothetical protein